MRALFKLAIKATFLVLLSGAAYAQTGQQEQVTPLPAAGSTQLIQTDLVAYWRANAPTCAAPDGFQFPSKIQADGDCDDGDINLFAGLLCASGEAIGCETVRRGQTSSGQWMRSPRRAQTDNLGLPNSFSHDMALGTHHYTVQTKDRAAFERWISWFNDHRPCWIGSGDNCLKGPFLRYCSNDPGSVCSLRPGDMAMLGRMANHFDAWPSDDLVAGTLRVASGAAIENVWASSKVNEAGFAQHLPAVEVFLLRRMGFNEEKLDEAVSNLSEKQPRNPFFLYLVEGKTPAVAALVTQACPNIGAPIPAARNEWSWERRDSDNASQRTMLWDCIFMANLLNG